MSARQGGAVAPRAARALRMLLVLLAAGGCVVGEGDALTSAGREQERADPYERSTAFPDGKVMQRPPAGTVPRGAVIGDLGAGPDGTPLTEIPVPRTPALLAEGAAAYRSFCAACHGYGGYGGSVVAMSLARDVPSSLRSPSALARTPGELYRIITNGYETMPPYAAQLTVPERWAVVAYVQELQRRPPLDALERQDSARAAAMLARRGARTPAGGADAGPPAPLPALGQPQVDTGGAGPLVDSLPVRRPVASGDTARSRGAPPP